MSEFILGAITGLVLSTFLFIWLVSDTYYKSQNENNRKAKK